MKTATRPLNEITQEATRLLYKELGVVNTIRFLNQFTTGYGDYTREREQLFENLSLDEIISEIKQMRGK
ncbi:MAG: hypothetical protein ACE5IR_12850 [bacterium]